MKYVVFVVLKNKHTFTDEFNNRVSLLRSVDYFAESEHSEVKQIEIVEVNR